jgi:IS5 family transposase
MKTDGRLGRNFLKGTRGDAMNALLCGAGHNLRKILRRLALLFASILDSQQRLLQKHDANSHRVAMVAY